MINFIFMLYVLEKKILKLLTTEYVKVQKKAEELPTQH